jgi:hypothetical protein
LPDFSWYKKPKQVKIYTMTTKYTKWPKNISNGRKIDQIVIKYKNKRFSIARPSKIYPNLDFWFENKPSGNPANELHERRIKAKIVCQRFSK